MSYTVFALLDASATIYLARQFVVSYPDPFPAAILLWAEVGLETKEIWCGVYWRAANNRERLLFLSAH